MARLRGHHTGRVSCPDQRFILLISHVADPVKPVSCLPVAADPGRQGGGTGVAAAGNEVHDLDGLLAFPRDRAADLRDPGGAGETGPAGTSTALIVRRARRPWPVLTAEVAGIAVQGSFLSCLSRAGMLALTVITQPACRPVMACAVSPCVCRAPAVMTAPARSVNAFSSSRRDPLKGEEFSAGRVAEEVR